MRLSRLAFVAVGVDHTTAATQVRERLAFAPAEIPAALQRLTNPANPLLDQAAILSTCNRVELYGVSQTRPDEHELVSFLARYHGLDPSSVATMVHVFRDDQVAHRLAATAAGIQSLVLGEAQILGQVRRGLEQALTAGTAGTELRRLFESAIAAGRRVRAETAIGRGAASVPQASVDFAHRRLGTLSQSTVLLIGTGDMAELAAKQLVKRGAKRLLVLGRTPSHAVRLAGSYGGLLIAPEGLDDALAQSDLVISATAAPQPILHRDQLKLALGRRDAGAAPLLLLDLAVPRDVDPDAVGLPGVEVHTIDDLRGMVEHALMGRRAELPQASAVLEREMARFTAWLSRREAAGQHAGYYSRRTQAGDQGPHGRNLDPTSASYGDRDVLPLLGA